MNIDPQLLGTWIIEPGDLVSVNQMGQVSMTFQPDHILKYIVQDRGTIVISHLTYWIDQDKIVTNQPPSVEYEYTTYVIEHNQQLILTKDKIRSRFIKNE